MLPIIKNLLRWLEVDPIGKESGSNKRWDTVYSLDLPQGLLTSWQLRAVDTCLWITYPTQPRSLAGGWGHPSLLVASFAAFQDEGQWPWPGGSKHLQTVWGISPTAPVCRAGSRPFLGRKDAVPIPSCWIWGLNFVFWHISSSLPLQKNWFLIIQKEYVINGKLKVPAVLW